MPNMNTKAFIQDIDDFAEAVAASMEVALSPTVIEELNAILIPLADLRMALNDLSEETLHYVDTD